MTTQQYPGLEMPPEGQVSLDNSPTVGYYLRVKTLDPLTWEYAAVSSGVTEAQDPVTWTGNHTFDQPVMMDGGAVFGSSGSQFYSDGRGSLAGLLQAFNGVQLLNKEPLSFSDDFDVVQSNVKLNASDVLSFYEGDGSTLGPIAAGTGDFSGAVTITVDGGAGGTINSVVDDFVVDCGNAAGGGFTLKCPNTGTARLGIADNNDNYRAGFAYFHSTDTFEFFGNDLNSLTLTSSGNVELLKSVGLHGVTPPAQAAHIADVPTGGSASAASNATAINSLIAVLENTGFTALT